MLGDVNIRFFKRKEKKRVNSLKLLHIAYVDEQN